MTKKIIRVAFLFFFSVIVTLLIFILFSYTGITLKVINFLMAIAGYDFYQGETRTGYTFNFIFGLLAMLFLFVLYISNRFVFRRKK